MKEFTVFVLKSQHDQFFFEGTETFHDVVERASWYSDEGKKRISDLCKDLIVKQGCEWVEHEFQIND